MTPLEELDDPDDDKRAFYRFPAGRKAIVLVAGSTMHFLLAIVLVFLALLISPIATSAPVISAPATCLSADATKACTTADQGSPAAGGRAAGR